MRRGMLDPMQARDSIAGLFGKAVKERQDVHGLVVVELFNERGRLKDRQETHNLILTAGKAMIADRLLASPTLGVPTHMGVGTGSTAPAVGDTALTAEVRVALTSKTRSTNVVTIVGDWAAGSATQTNAEAGLWDASSGGILNGRATFTGIAKGASDTLKVTWTWTFP
jgi:hypothetical protein